ncbi:MAG: lipopolysaccharide biosynthesis protein [Caenibius sp.]
MPAKARKRPMPESLLGRMFANTMWLLGGKGFGAICSLVYLAIITRSLGLKGFGHFSLIFGTSQALIAIAGFQTWRIVVRYGATHVQRDDWGAFGRLSMLCGLLDAAGAVMGCLAAWVIFYQFNHALDLNPDLVGVAFWFNVAALWALVSSPTGIVRALNRFDIATYVEAIVPLGRLLAAGAIWLTGPTLVKFLVAWAVIDLIEAALYWLMARILAPKAIGWNALKHWRQSLHENDGIMHFFWVTYATATIDAVKKNGPLLAVGYFVGTKGAGLFRLAQQLSQGLGKFSALLTRAAYAEISRARFAVAKDEFRKLTAQTSLIASAAGLLVIGLSLLLGKQLLLIVGGETFMVAYPVLVAMAVSAAFELGGVAFEPALHSTGNARKALWAKLVSLAVLLAIFVPLAHRYEALGIAIAVAISAAVAYVIAGFFAWRRIDDIPTAGQSLRDGEDTGP